MARQTQGFDSLIAFGKEATQGTAPAAGVFKSWGITSGWEPEVNKNHEPIRGIGQRTVLNHKALGQEVTSTWTGYLQDPRPLWYALGGAVTKTGAANAWVHTFSSVGRCQELPTFTVNTSMCINNTPFITNYIGSKVDTLTISASAGEAVEVEMEIVSKDAVDNAPAASTYDYPTNEIMTFADGEVTINGSGTPAANIKEFELEFANNLEALMTISKGITPTYINEGIFDITGSLTVALSDTATRAAFRAGTEFTAKFRFDDPTVPANYFEITLSGAKYDTDSLGIEADGETDYELDCLFRTASIKIGSKDISDITV
ncbi:phage tail tube protein [Bacillus toyonensis]|uniref:phage tail tube protein n=1 Tax=Bacillus toyonensis TaxID=155322 RepID=UPI000BF4DDC8|nr:phage tail tube protein [Bacillus toyonensis]PGF00893.1 hypothetical protein COM61_22835 [Bacillus toyonensis]PHE46985.1 hypothetical protein COF71_13585 [Bacillus toyonensis]